MDHALAWLHAVAWAAYVGGALTMEFVLRFAQRTMPGSQVAEVCKRAGSTYRWYALGALLIIGASGAAMLPGLDGGAYAERAAAPDLALGSAYGRTLWALVAAWGVLVAAVAVMAFKLHPDQRRRSRPGMTREEIQAERERVGVAIRRMDRVLRFELGLSIVAVGLGASLHAGGVA